MLRVFLVIDDYNELIYLQSLLKKLGLDVESVQNQKKYADMSLGFNPHILIATAKGQKVDGLQLTQSLYRKRGLPKVILLKNSDQNNDVSLYRDAGVDDVLDSPVNPRRLILAIANLGGVDETALLEKYAKIKGQFHNGGEENITYVGSYDDNGQPVENVHRLRQNIESIKPGGSGEITSGEGIDASQFRKKSESFEEGAASPEPRFKLRDAESLGESLSESAEENDEETVLEPKSERSAVYEAWAAKIGPLEPKHFVRDRILDFNKKIRSIVVEDIDQIEDERKKFVKALFKTGSKK